MCALIILLDLSLLVFLSAKAYNYSLLFLVLSDLVTVAVFLSLINRDANPEFKITWLVVLLLIPTFGALLYLLFYSRRLTKKESRFSSELCSALRDNMAGCGDAENSLLNLDELSNLSVSAAGRAHALLRDDMLSLVCRGACQYYPSGEELYYALLSALRGAERYIFLEYFIIEDGEMWQGIYDILKEKVKCGVEVRMLYDDVGSMGTLPESFDKRLRKEGISCYRFARVRPTLSSSLQNRDHRKIAVIDGRIAFTGGVNIADEYINKKVRFGHWKDGGISTSGMAARAFARFFLAQYDLTVREISDYGAYITGLDTHPAFPKTDKNAENAENHRTGADKTAENGEKLSTDSAFLVPFCDGPAPISPESVGKNIFLNTIHSANSYLYITTPYLIIDYELTEALRGAVGRGVDVRIVTPAVADKRLVKIMTKNSYSYLTRAGVRIFEYSPGFIHEKLLVADGESAIVGTINLDYRSFVHHFEDGVFVYGSDAVAAMRDGFLDTESKSHEILPKNARLRFHERIIRDLIRIFAPLM